MPLGVRSGDFVDGDFVEPVRPVKDSRMLCRKTKLGAQQPVAPEPKV